MARAWRASAGPQPDVNVAAFNGSVTINASSTDPLLDEYQAPGQSARFDLYGGLLSWVLTDDAPGSVRVQALNDIIVNGHGRDTTGTVRTSYAAIAAGSLGRTGVVPKGGTIDVRSLEGQIVANNRAFELIGRNNSAGFIRLWASDEIELSRPGANNNFNPVVKTSGANSGGDAFIQSFAAGIAVNANAQVLSSVPSGSNNLVSCTGVTNSGTITPADGNAGDDSGVCPAGPAPIFDSCSDFGVEQTPPD
jgi:hypothetical protein